MRVTLSILIYLIHLALVQGQEVELLHVSYDPTRELFVGVNGLFAAEYEKKTGIKVRILQSHGGSSKQARSILEGLKADMTSLAIGYDLEVLGKHGMLDPNWSEQFPAGGSPFYSTIVFLVRKGNPKKLRDWPDLVRPGIQIVTANPKTSGGARWNFLAAWAYATCEAGLTEEQSIEFMKRLFKNVPLLDSGSRAATSTFFHKQIGDVYLAWESEAALALKELPEAQVEIVHPPASIMAQPAISLVHRNLRRRGPEVSQAAQAYVRFLFSEQGQQLAAHHGYRPVNDRVLDEHAARFPKLRLIRWNEVAPSWMEAQNKFFGEGAIFDQIYRP